MDMRDFGHRVDGGDDAVWTRETPDEFADAPGKGVTSRALHSLEAGEHVGTGKTVPWPAIIAAAALVVVGAVCVAYAHDGMKDAEILNVYVLVTEYERERYDDFDLVRIKLAIDNKEPVPMRNPTFRLGGGVGDTTTNHTDVREEYGAVSSGDIRDRGINVSMHDCSAKGLWNPIPAGSIGRAVLCFVVDKPFRADGLLVGADVGHVDNHGTCYHYTAFGFKVDNRHDYTQWPLCAFQVVPLREESTYCFDRYFGFCRADNVQRIDSVAAKPTSVEVQYAIYYDGTLVMVFDHPVVVYNQNRIGIVSDMHAYEWQGLYTGLGNATLLTGDGKRASATLVLDLDDYARGMVAAGLDRHGELAVVVDRYAAYADGTFDDITNYNGRQPILFDGTVLVR